MRRHWRDILIAFLFGLCAALASYQGAKLIPAGLLDTWDVWFQADFPRVYANMTDRWSDHSRSTVHPLFSLFMCPPVYGLKRTLGIDSATAVRLLTAGMAALWIVCLFATMRLIGCRRFDAAVFSMLGATSAAAMFWFVVPESWPLGSFSIILALLLMAWAEHQRVSEWWFMAVSTLTMSITLTNWMAGITATFVHHPWKRAFQVTVNTFALVLLLWGVEKLIFPTANIFLGHVQHERLFVLSAPGGPLSSVRSFFFHSMVMPAIETTFLAQTMHAPERYIMVTQPSLPGSGSAWGFTGALLWLALLALGVWSLLTIHGLHSFRLGLGLILLGQFGLHVLYGEETLLFSLHFLPLLVTLTVLSTLTRFRMAALALAGLLLTCVTINNGQQFKRALEISLPFIAYQLKGSSHDPHVISPSLSSAALHTVPSTP